MDRGRPVAGAIAPDASPSRDRSAPTRPRTTVRTSILATVLSLTFAGMAISGVLAYLVQRDRVDERIDETLTRIATEYREAFAETADPLTNAPFESTSQVLHTSMMRVLPVSHGGSVAMVDGKVEWTSPIVQGIHPERDPAFVASFADVDAESRVTIDSASTSVGELRYVAIPVRLSGDAKTGVYVVVIDRDREMAFLTESYRTYAEIAAGSFLVIALIAWLVTRRLMRPLRWLRSTTERITQEDLSERIPVRGNDDLATLSRTVNGMLDRLETAFGANRRLLDDVAHELRTPVTIVRGNLEVIDADDPDDVRESVDIAVDELDQMSRLIDSLMLLARTGQQPLRSPGPVDLANLARTTFAKARLLGDRDWQLRIAAEPTLVADEHQIAEAVLELATNAVRYSEPGSRIVIAVSATTDEARIAVEDEGIGIPKDALGRIFDRFSRVHAGRGKAGSGLGLPIVQALVTANDGAVEVRSTPSKGSAFTLVFPLAARVGAPARAAANPATAPDRTSAAGAAR